MEVLDLTKYGGVPLVADGCMIPFKSAPHIHVHTLYSDLEAEANNESVQELCCHGCGGSLFIKFSWADMVAHANHLSNLVVAYGEEFVVAHVECCTTPIKINDLVPETDDFNYICPNERSDEIETIDLTGEEF